jgi:MoxR-like ATPase
MNIKQLKRFLPYAIKAKASVMVHGLHGIGKSQCVKQFAEENGMNFIDRRLSQVESGDLLGLPDVSGDVTKYKLPSWLPTEVFYS